MRRIATKILRACSGLFALPLLALVFAFHGSQFGPNSAPKQEQQSLRALRAHIAELRTKHPEAEGIDRRNGFVKEDESLDYLDALEAYLSVRAFPNDRVDWDAIRRGVAHRDGMTTYVPRTTIRWESLGPKNCASPYQWAFGPGRVSGRIASAAYDPTNASTIYVATAGGGVWKTTDAGATWNPMGDGWSDTPTSCVVVDPRNPSVIYAGTGDWDGWGGYSQGIEKSIDGGVNWTAIGGVFANFSVRRILIDPDNSSIVTAVTGRGAGGDGQVWRSTDGGDSWTAVITANALWSDIVCSKADGQGNRVYYAVAGGTYAQMWKSTDRGATWARLTVPMRSGVSTYDTADIAASANDPATIYLLGTGNQRVWKSTNYGSTWTSITDANLSGADWGQAWYDFYITCGTNGTSDVLYVGLIDILQSTNGGTSWHTFMQGYTGNDLAHVDEHDMVPNPLDPTQMLACNDGGVYNVVVNGNSGTFTSLNSGLGVTEFYYGDVNPTDGSKLLGGAQDNGSPAARGNLTSWACVSGGDGGAALINQTNPLIQYTTYQFFGGSSTGGTIGMNRTSDGWTSNSSWVSVNVGSDRVGWMGPIVMAATNSSILYVGTNYLWKYNDVSSSWTSRLGNQLLSPSSTIASIGVTRSDPTVIYTGSGDGYLYKTSDSGQTWLRIDTGSVPLPSRAYTAIRVKDDNANDVLVGLSGTGSSHLWRCADTSASSRVWIDVSGVGPSGLPDIPINGVERDPADPTSTWYVGTDIGVFKTQDGGSTWQNITQPLGLPNVQISQLAVRNGYLYAITYGRGMWRLNITGSGGGGVTLTGLGLNPRAVVGPAPSTGTVTLSGPAPTGGATVALSSTNPNVASVPPSVTVPEGAISATFQVTTTVVPSQVQATIQGSLAGTVASDILTINPNGLTNISLNPVSVIGGNTSQGTVTIATPAPLTGALIQLNSSNTAVAQVPATVTIPYNQTSATFTITTTPTANDATSTIRATFGTSTVSSQLTVNAPTVQNFSLSTNTVVGGNPVTGTIALTGRAPSGGLPIALSSSATSVASVPASVTVPANATSVNFTVTTHLVTIDSGVTITEILHGLSRVVDLSVTAQHLASVTVTPNPAVGGNTLQGRVALAGPAVGSIVVQLSSTNTSLVSVPASVTIASGQTSATFSVTTHTVPIASSADVLAVAGGSSQQTTVQLTPLLLSSFTLSNNVTFERSVVVGTVTLNGAALSGGAVIHLTNSNPSAATMPTTVTIPQGATRATFNITAASVTSSQSTTITAQLGAIAIQQTLTVVPITLQSLQLNLSTVTGGTLVSGVVRLVAPAPSGGYVVSLSSSYTNAATVPTTVTIPAGATSAVFTVTSRPVPQTYFVTITGAHGLSHASAQLQVLPPEVSSFRLSTTSTRGGNSLTGTVTLTGRAPTGGMVVHINANPYLAWPSNGTGMVTVPAGSTSVSFTINTAHVSASTPVNLSAITLSITRSVTLTLTP